MEPRDETGVKAKPADDEPRRRFGRRKKTRPYSTPGYRYNTGTGISVGAPLMSMGLLILFSAYVAGGTALWIGGAATFAAGLLVSSFGRVY